MGKSPSNKQAMPAALGYIVLIMIWILLALPFRYDDTGFFLYTFMLYGWGALLLGIAGIFLGLVGQIGVVGGTEDVKAVQTLAVGYSIAMLLVFGWLLQAPDGYSDAGYIAHVKERWVLFGEIRFSPFIWLGEFVNALIPGSWFNELPEGISYKAMILPQIIFSVVLLLEKLFVQQKMVRRLLIFGFYGWVAGIGHNIAELFEIPESFKQIGGMILVGIAALVLVSLTLSAFSEKKTLLKKVDGRVIIITIFLATAVGLYFTFW